METVKETLKIKMSEKYCDLTRFNYLDPEEKIMIYKAMQEYAKQACKEQRKICKRTFLHAGGYSNFAHEIQNAPEPKFE